MLVSATLPVAMMDDAASTDNDEPAVMFTALARRVDDPVTDTSTPDVTGPPLSVSCAAPDTSSEEPAVTALCRSDTDVDAPATDSTFAVTELDESVTVDAPATARVPFTATRKLLPVTDAPAATLPSASTTV